MSRKMLTIAALAFIALPITTAQSQMSVGIGAGASPATGDFGKGVDMGYHVMGLLAFAPPLAPLGFRIEGMFNEFNSKPVVGFPDYKSRVMSLSGNAVFSPPGMVVLAPYLIGGIGMYNQSISPKPAGTESESDLGFNLGGGIKFGLAGFSAFGEIRYHQVSGTGGARFIPITFGLMF